MVCFEVVFYEEFLWSQDFDNVIIVISIVDLFIVGGILFNVYLVVVLLRFFCGWYLVFINCEVIGYDWVVDFVIYDGLGKMLFVVQCVVMF